MLFPITSPDDLVLVDSQFGLILGHACMEFQECHLKGDSLPAREFGLCTFELATAVSLS
jgi:hypothetical protein